MGDGNTYALTILFASPSFRSKYSATLKAKSKEADVSSVSIAVERILAFTSLAQDSGRRQGIDLVFRVSEHDS
jgi:hypothetical protein